MTDSTLGAPIHHGAGGFDDAGVAARLEAEAEFAAGVTAAAIARCIQHRGGASWEVRRIVDLGCGPGVAAVMLAEVFASATVVAVDRSPLMLARVSARAARHEVAARVDVRSFDLDTELATLGVFDLVWAALALHHAADELLTLRRFGALVRRRGVLCLLERAEPVVVSASVDLGRPGIWERLRAAQATWFERARPSLPGIADASGYARMIEQAGLELLESRLLSATVTTGDHPPAQLLLTGFLTHAERRLGELIDAADRDAIRARCQGRSDSDPDWGEITVTSSRTLVIARPAEARE